ncbi:hypothetical protein [Streptomyces sp. A0642]|uniref:hypothetical protein n=1 Tax=Streptomyces sp. A0642 TaxID=2563100 RepID=UPI0019D1E7B1|nr:hypothetical protein [Streptomyces sp. A0642]
MNSTTPTTPTAPVAEGDTTTDTATEKTVADAGVPEAPATRLDKTAPEPGADPDQDQDLDEDQDLGPDQDLDESDEERSSALATGAAAVVTAGLGIVSLTGAWSGRVAAERETLTGQMKTSSGGSAAQQISEIYGDAWHATALVNGLFGLLALLVGVYVLVRPAFGTPSAHPQPGWIRAVAKGGLALAGLGVLLAVCMYFDLIVPLPTAPATAG